MTSYHYPTWADILGRKWPAFENWGGAGGGNLFVFNSIIECDARNNLTGNDTVIVLWTGVARHDVYQFYHWIPNIGLFPKNEHDSLVNCPRGYEIQSYAFMKAIDDLLSTKKVRYLPYTWVDYDLDGSIGDVYGSAIKKIKKIKIDRVPKKYQPVYLMHRDQFWRSYYDSMSGPDWPSFDVFLSGEFGAVPAFVQHELTVLAKEMTKDKKLKFMAQTELHPGPSEHLDIARQLLPEFVPDADCMRWIMDIEQDLIQGKQFDFDRHLPTRL